MSWFPLAYRSYASHCSMSVFGNTTQNPSLHDQVFSNVYLFVVVGGGGGGFCFPEFTFAYGLLAYICYLRPARTFLPPICFGIATTA